MMRTESSIIGVLIVDDEPDARELLVTYLSSVEGVEIVGLAGDAVEASELIKQRRPHVILLDIQMPEQDAFGLIESIGTASMPEVIFTTAYDEFALKAFEINAVDYLLKPFSRQRLIKALERARTRLGKSGEEHSRVLKKFLHDYQRATLAGDGDQQSAAHLKRIVIKSTNPWKKIDCDAIFSIKSEGAYTSILTEGKSFTHFESISALEKNLNPMDFMRVHRGAIVNLRKVSRVVTLPFGTRQVILTNNSKIKVSRSYREELQARLVLVDTESS